MIALILILYLVKMWHNLASLEGLTSYLCSLGSLLQKKWMDNFSSVFKFLTAPFLKRGKNLTKVSVICVYYQMGVSKWLLLSKGSWRVEGCCAPSDCSA